MEFFIECIILEMERVKERLVAKQPRLEDHHRKIIRYVRMNGSIASRDYAKISSRKRSIRIIDFKFLTENEILVRRGNGKGSFYILNEEIVL